ncbi:MAG TPA: protoporphyrinogen oxidase [Thermoanaerobaculia bacterium]|nr:protoporphyrinogen oxidase [Thermoanaerobaculia bacterium]
MTAERQRRDCVVVGAGITGLTAAFHLERGGSSVTVLEAAADVGGAMRTYREGDWLCELGPNTVLEKEPMVELLHAAGLDDAVLAARPAAKKRYLWKGDRLEPMPSGPGSLLTTPLFPLAAKLALLKEPWVRRPADGREESIAEFVRRRLGATWLDYAVGPFVSGVYAGDPARLSVRWAVPRIAALEEEHGSLIRGALAKRKGPQPGGRMMTLHEGLAQLPRHLAGRCADVRTATPAQTVSAAGGGGFTVGTPTGAVACRSLILAIPADATAALLCDLDGESIDSIAAVPHAPVVVVSLGYRREAVSHPLDGFGFLAPRVESLRILGCLFPSTMFPGRAPDGHVLLTAFAGGRMDPELVAAPDAQVDAVVRDDLARALGVRGEPLFRHLARWPRAIPQYEVGHGRVVEAVRRLERRRPGLYVAGSFTGGVSVPDCVQRGGEVAARVLAAAVG